MLTRHRVLQARALTKGWQLPAVVTGWVVVIVATHLGPRVLPLPDLSGAGGVTTPLASLGAVVCAVLALLTATEPAPPVFVTAPRHAPHTNLTRVAVTALTGPALVAALGPGTWSATTSTTLAFTGEGLLFASLIGIRLAWLPISLHFLAAATVGAANREDLHAWAWVLQPEPTAANIAVSTFIATVGLAAWAVAVRRNSSVLEL